MRAGPAHAAPGVIEGTVFRDWNQNGVQDPAGGEELAEPGIDGIEVRAFDATGTGVGPANSGPDGHYSISLAGLSDAVSSTFRVEFTIPAALSYLKPGPMPAATTAGTVRNGTSVQFSAATGEVAVGAGGVDFGVANPVDYCQPNPKVVTPCFIGGEPAPELGTLKTFNYDLSGNVEDIATQGEIGSTWGVAWDRTARLLYEAAFTKRHAPFAPGSGDDGPDQIFVTDPDLRTSAVFTTIEAGTDLHDSNDLNLDLTVWDAVGRTGFGDMDIAEDDSVLYVVNMFDRRLYEVEVAAPANRTAFDFPDPGTGVDGCPIHPATAAGELNRNLVPGGVKVRDGVIYVTLTCTAEDVGGQPNAAGFLRGFVYTFDRGSATFTQVANFPFDYARDPRTPPKRIPDWQAWITSPPTTPAPGVASLNVYPQPWLMDVEIDSQGFMIVGVADRFGHQAGALLSGVGAASGLSAGDILRLAPTGATFTLESNGSVGGSVAIPAQRNLQGPGGGEFYYQDDRGSDNEITLGGLAHKPGSNEVLTTVFDPFRVWSGGVHYYRNTTTGPGDDGGEKTRAIELFRESAPHTFGKAAGLGDLELLCDAAPVEIGNRAWLDLDADGIQDPEEPALANVTVELIDSGGTVLGTALTAGDGNYTFALTPGEPYTLRFDTSTVTAADLPTGHPTAPLVFTTANAGNDPRIDSDPTAGLTGATVSVPAHAPGNNDHTFDAGVTARRQRLGNLVWSDLNDNALVDAGEPGIPDVTVELFADANGNAALDPGADPLVSTTVSSSTGAYFFTGLSDGTYFVAVPAGQPALDGTRSSTGVFPGSTDNDDNGDPVGTFASVSGPIPMELATPQPMGETDSSGADDEARANALTGEHPDQTSNLTVDFGFFKPVVVDEGPKVVVPPPSSFVKPVAKDDVQPLARPDGKLSKGGAETRDQLMVAGALVGAGLVLLGMARVRRRRVPPGQSAS